MKINQLDIAQAQSTVEPDYAVNPSLEPLNLISDYCCKIRYMLQDMSHNVSHMPYKSNVDPYLQTITTVCIEALKALSCFSMEEPISWKVQLMANVANEFLYAKYFHLFTSVVVAQDIALHLSPIIDTSWQPQYFIATFIQDVFSKGPGLLAKAKANQYGYEKLKRSMIFPRSIVAIKNSTTNIVALYVIHSQIGKGASKFVRKLVPLGGNKEELAQLSPIICSNVTEIGRVFVYEAKVAQAITLAGAKYILPMVAYHFKGKVRLISPLCDQGNVHHLLSKKALTKDVRMNIALQLCHDVVIMHDVAKMGHFDLKTANLLIKTIEGTPTLRICDFGASNHIHTTENNSRVSWKTTYPPPEMTRTSTHPAMAAIDLWALGLILYQLTYEVSEYALIKISNAHHDTPQFMEAHAKVIESCSENNNFMDQIICQLLCILPDNRPSAKTVYDYIATHLSKHG